jgi:uncharacterized protein (DUF58 family)
MAVAVMIVGTWWLVAHSSGAGWVQTLGDIVFAMLAIGIFGPPVILARTRIAITRAPTDGTAGLPLEMTVTSSTRLRIRPVDPPGPETFTGPARGARDARGARGAGRSQTRPDPVTLLPVHRGLHDCISIEIATAAPFGLQWWARQVRLPLASPLHVAPRRGQPIPLPRWCDDDAGDQGRRVPLDPDELRGTRPYRSGDSRRHMHWPATAHAGELMVRELEGPAAEPLTVSVTLPADPEEAERVAEQALGTILRLFDRGAPVLLATTERSGPVTSAVADRRAAGRRLARAVPALPVPATSDRPAPATPDGPAAAIPDRPTVATPDRPTVATPDRPAAATPHRPAAAAADKPGRGQGRASETTTRANIEVSRWV